MNNVSIERLKSRLERKEIYPREYVTVIGLIRAWNAARSTTTPSVRTKSGEQHPRRGLSPESGIANQDQGDEESRMNNGIETRVGGATEFFVLSLRFQLGRWPFMLCLK